MTGIRWAESNKSRSTANHVETCFQDRSGKRYFSPIIDWTDADVWAFIHKEVAIPYCTLYDEGFPRHGCILCPYGYKKKTGKRNGTVA